MGLAAWLQNLGWAAGSAGAEFRPTAAYNVQIKPRSVAEGPAFAARSTAEGTQIKARTVGEGAQIKPRTIAEGAEIKPRTRGEGTSIREIGG